MKTEKIGHDWVTGDSKRRLDLAIASGASAPAAIVVGGLALCSRVKEGEDAFFSQTRLGLNLEGFKMLKLRTMPAGTIEARAHLLPPGTVTAYQQAIRTSRLNELPQLFNILRGDMSVVGPRPQIICHFEETMDALSPRQQTEWRQARSYCRPGVVDPYIVENDIQDRQADDPIARAESDIQYYHTASLRTDLLTVRQLAKTVLSRQPGSIFASN